MPIFALHTVLFPGQSMGLRVFEERYLALLDDVAPTGGFAVVAIRHGQEVGGPYEANRVGVTVATEAHVPEDDGTHRLQVAGVERVALIEIVRDDPSAVWQTEPFPDEGGAGTDDVQAAVVEMRRYLGVTGEPAELWAVPNEPVAASYALAAATPGLVPERQALLEIPGAGERVRRVGAIFRRETALVRALGATVGSATVGTAGHDLNPN